MTVDLDGLYEAAEALLAVASQAVASAPGGPIEYQAVTQGLPSFDCPPALYVTLGSLVVGDTLPLQPPLEPLQRIVTTGIVDLTTFTITVLRCVSTIEQDGQTILLPSAAQVSLDARVCYADLWAVWNALVGAHRAGNLFGSPSGRREFAVDPALPVRTEGGAGGWLIPVRGQVPGFAGSVA